ncbi:MAG: Ig-like domain-containing protein [Cytophagaceae bacterium]|jgi:uncharacterized protein (DUF2141 family)|nr:Ig-like domain-containing protein [Cytophagaceae bacterium]
MKNTLLFIALLGIFIYMGGGCASTGYPEGGPKDEAPPMMVKSTPALNALNFKGKEIVISFNEIIVIKDVFTKLIISPPVNKRPAVTSRGRDLVIKFEEDLQPNTTYTLDFSDAISDNNENNVLQNFRFSFATGTDIDSLSISGHLFDAATLAPVAGAFVVVYSNLADSAFRTQVPIRLAKTDEKGAFSVQNLAAGQYRVYALEDANRNYFYDQPGERIAWHPQLIEPTIGYRERTDSIAPDSVVTSEYQVFLPDSLQLFMFQEDNAVQYMKNNKRPARNKVDFVFNRPLEKPLEINRIGADAGNDWFLYEQGIFADSVTLWITDSTVIKSDSLFMVIGYMAKDSLNQPFLKTDTLNAYFFEVGGGESSQRQRRRGKDDKEKEASPVLTLPTLARTLDVLGEFSIVFPTPIADYNRSKLHLFQQIDTIQTPIDFQIEKDSLQMRRYIVKHVWESGEKYLFIADSAAFADVYDAKTDSIGHSFNVKSIDSYGIIRIGVINHQPNWFLQVLDRQDKVVRQATLPKNGKRALTFIPPGEYFIRIVDDVNGNGKWDTGILDTQTQPERIIYFHKTVNVRANWDVTEEWTPAEFNIYDFVQQFRQKTAGRR